MEDLFKKFLVDKKKNTVNEIIKWLKNAKILDGNSAQKAIGMFSGENQNNIPFGKFKEVVTKFAGEKKWDMETIMKNLTEAAVIPEAGTAIAKLATGALGGFGKK